MCVARGEWMASMGHKARILDAVEEELDDEDVDTRPWARSLSSRHAAM